MIPNLVAKELKETLLDYLDTTFSFQDRNLAESLETFLSDKQKGMFKGAFLNIKLPFRKQDPSKTIPLDIAPDFTPYQHQSLAFDRLSSKANHKPQPTLITTGTGSGKTECFLFPILDHVARNQTKPGIKALILYPMNALAFDQARRIAKLIFNHKQLKGQTTVGMYVGGKGATKTMGPDFVITDKDTLQKNPPDILLTNYKMLDYLLLRPEDQALWKDNSPVSLRYIVLDELHTYDGVQGGDVACLLRRLRAKLKAQEDAITPVGTSATLSNNDAEALSDLVKFAQNIFGTPIPKDSVILEDRLTASEFFPKSPTSKSLPSASDQMQIQDSDDIPSYIQRQIQLWFASSNDDPIDVGQNVLNHKFTRTVFEVLDNQVLDYAPFMDKLAKTDSDFRKLTSGQQEDLLTSFLALLSYSKFQDNGRVVPLSNVQIQIWIREIRRLMRQISDTPKFFWRDEVPKTSEPKGFPMISCRECGYAGWVTLKRPDDSRLSDDTAEIGRAVIEDRSKKALYLFPGSNPDELIHSYVCPKCLTLSHDTHCLICSTQGVPVIAHQRASKGPKPKNLSHCPACDTNFALNMVGSQAASLSSVSISHLYQSGFNTDKKLLAFTDSVQDASHRASFFANRTYRFGLRTAIQTVIDHSPSGEIDLPDYTKQFFDYWLAELPSKEVFIATFLPPDLMDIHQNRDYNDPVISNFRKSELEKELFTILQNRLSWEIALEYGLNQRQGRTLSKSKCSTIYIKPDVIDSLVEGISESLKNEISQLRSVSNDEIRHFILGLLSRQVERGGIDHPMLKSYIENENRYMLMKYKNPHMSPFGGNIRLPKFLTDKPNAPIFDNYPTTHGRMNWYLDWAKRCLNDSLDQTVVNDLYERVINALTKQDVLHSYNSAKGKAKVYAVNPRILGMSNKVVLLHSPNDGSQVPIRSTDKPLWQGMPSLAFRSKNNTYTIDTNPRGAYYQKIYKSGRIQRIFSQEHSSILNRTKREEVESLFKSGAAANAPNLITCTPTMEMGIDVGDLSATMVCSIPPSTTNYLQRIGRAGRETGNALVLAMANAKPHDLYFYEDPQEMISGVIYTPGCYLNAPEMLTRHFTAFCMDQWAGTAQPGDLPNKMSFIIKTTGNQKGFPNSFYDYYKQNKATLIKEYLDLFSQGDISDDNKLIIDEFAKQDQVVLKMSQVFRDVTKEAEELKRIIDRVAKEKKKIEQNPQKYDEPAEEIERCTREIKALRKQRTELYWGAYPLNVLTNWGVLPNYAFPEEGVKLTSIITGIEVDDGTGNITNEYEVHEYRRGAATAIREFAPLNTFYGEGRKVEIDLIETGGLENSNIETWRFCDSCAYMEQIKPGDKANNCPQCQSPMWKDSGQQHEVLRLKAVGSKVSHIKSLATDESDERDKKSYQVHDYIGFKEKDLVGGFYAPDKVFGFEFIKHVTLSEVNFGINDPIGQKMLIAGAEVPDAGFIICPDCGIVNQETDPAKPTAHRRHCRYHDKKAKEVPWSNTFLYRQLQSEAIRILLPVSAFAVPEKLHSFKCALELGFRKLFKGNPGHLLIKEQSEPLEDETGAFRRYLVICDTVPGGTGYLKDVVFSGGLLKAMELAYETLTTCDCNKDDHLDGCYRCIYAYKHQFQIENISRDRAVRMLEEILASKDSLEKIVNLSKISIVNVLESELEERFVDLLKEHALATESWQWEDIVIKGKPGGLLKVKGVEWKVEPQVDFDSTRGISRQSRPDLVFWPEPGNPGEPTALFLDGYRYHVSPGSDESAMPGDIEKRQAIIAANGYQVWTLTWYDLDEFKDSVPGQTIFSGSALSNFSTILNQSGVTDLQASSINSNAIELFFHYLTKPAAEQWQKFAFSLSAVFVTSKKRRRIPQEIEDALDIIRNSEDVSGLSLTDSEDTDHPFAELIQKNFITHLSSAPLSALGSKDASQLTSLTRIETDKDSRGDALYREEWRIFWQTMNWLQFLSKTEIITA
jgi:DEAD/DEAH box helicase domain-containing protein